MTESKVVPSREYHQTFTEGLTDIYKSAAHGEALFDEFEVCVPDVDVSELRKDLRLTQKQFANKFGLNLFTVRNWEQNRTGRDKPTKLLLYILSELREPVLKAVDRLNERTRSKDLA